MTSQVSAVTYTIQDLGSLGYTNIRPLDINNQGQVVGRTHTGTTYVGFFWDSNDGIVALDQMSEARGINDSGLVAGYKVYSPSFLYDSTLGTYRQLPSAAHDINTSGQVTGHSFPSYSRAWIWEDDGTSDGKITNLGTLPGYEDNTYATRINDLGYVVGHVQKGSDVLGYISNGTTMSPLSGHPHSTANDINESGVVVGWSGDHTDEYSAALWETNGIEVTNYIDLGILQGDAQAFALGVNASGQVVGLSRGNGQEGFIWDSENLMQDLNDLISDESGWTLTSATAINDLGQIVGSGIYGGQERAFILTPDPIPEPATMLLLGSGLVGLAGFRRKHKKT